MLLLQCIGMRALDRVRSSVYGPVYKDRSKVHYLIQYMIHQMKSLTLRNKYVMKHFVWKGIIASKQINLNLKQRKT